MQNATKPLLRNVWVRVWHSWTFWYDTCRGFLKPSLTYTQNIDERCKNGVDSWGPDSWGPDNWVVRGSVDSGCHNRSKKLAIKWMSRLYTDEGRTEREAICVTKLEITLLSIKGSPRCVQSEEAWHHDFTNSLPVFPSFGQVMISRLAFQSINSCLMH